MLERILLPTDGSELSERALGIAETLAHAQGAELILARVIEPPWWTATDDSAHDYGGPEVYEQVMEAMEIEARAGLDELSERLKQRNVNATTVLLKGRASMELLALEEREKPDLVVMATHGRTGFARFALGSVADRLVREGISPVLVVRSFSPEVSWTERALVPLDGSDLAEQALPMVESLAGKPLRWVKLLTVVDSHQDVPAATAYLAPIAVRMATAGLEVIPEVRVGTPASEITGEAQSVDLVILGTHGRGGLDRLRHGSMAEQATHHLAVPVLLIRAKEAVERDPVPDRTSSTQRV
jgi:nucleotide-binding universal stress UspA family protein